VGTDRERGGAVAALPRDGDVDRARGGGVGRRLDRRGTIHEATSARGGAGTVAVPGGVLVWGGSTRLRDGDTFLGDGVLFVAP
jgi:hypothetical protein